MYPTLFYPTPLNPTPLNPPPCIQPPSIQPPCPPHPLLLVSLSCMSSIGVMYTMHYLCFYTPHYLSLHYCIKGERGTQISPLSVQSDYRMKSNAFFLRTTGKALVFVNTIALHCHSFILCSPITTPVYLK